MNTHITQATIDAAMEAAHAERAKFMAELIANTRARIAALVSAPNGSAGATRTA